MEVEKSRYNTIGHRSKFHQRTSEMTHKWKPRFSREQEIKKFGYCSITTPCLIQVMSANSTNMNIKRFSPSNNTAKVNDSLSLSNKQFSKVQTRVPINLASMQINQSDSKKQLVRPSTAIMKKSRLASLIERTHKK